MGSRACQEKRSGAAANLPSTVLPLWKALGGRREGLLGSFDMKELRRRAYALALRMGVPRQDAEDIAQEVIVRVTRAQADGKIIVHAEAFAVRTGIRLAIDRLREVQGHSRKLRRLGRVRPATAQPAELPEDVARLHRAIAALPDRQAAVIVLRRIMELEYATIADILGITVATCQSHCRYGLQNLRRILGEQ